MYSVCIIYRYSSVIVLLDKPTLKYLMKELHPTVSDKWVDIGKKLKVDVDKMIEIGTKYPEDSKKCLKKTMREWLRAHNPSSSSWETIAQIVDDLGEDDLATHLRSKYSVQ